MSWSEAARQRARDKALAERNADALADPAATPLRRARVAKNFTQRELGRAAQLGRNRIELIERGLVKNPTEYTKQAIASVLRVPVSELWPAA